MGKWIHHLLACSFSLVEGKICMLLFTLLFPPLMGSVCCLLLPPLMGKYVAVVYIAMFPTWQFHLLMGKCVAFVYMAVFPTRQMLPRWWESVWLLFTWQCSPIDGKVCASVLHTSFPRRWKCLCILTTSTHMAVAVATCQVVPSPPLTGER